MRIISIDPGLNQTGIAVFRENEGEMEPMVFTLTVPAGCIKLTEKLYYVAEAMEHNYGNYAPDTVLIESMVTEKVKATSYSRSKYKNISAMVKNTLVVGVIAGVAQTRGIDVELIASEDWKGRQAKESTQWLVEKFYNMECNNHEADAVWMGRWWLERQKTLKEVK